MSLYALHRAVYDFIRAGQSSDSPTRSFDVNGYDLTEDERKAFQSQDVAALYQMGLHAVLLNAFCRAIGFGRDEYRKILEPFGTGEAKRGRWQT